MRLTLLLATTLALGSSAAFGQDAAAPAAKPAPGTEAGAKALAADLAAYVSRAALDRGIVTVTPYPAGYRIALDVKPLVDTFAGAEGTFQVAPYSLVASPLGDGAWSVGGSDPIAVKVDVTVGGARQTVDYAIGPGSFSGVFSPELGTMLSAMARYKGGTVTSSEAGTTVKASFGAMAYDMSARKAGPGTVDFTSTQTIADFMETVTAAFNPETPGETFPVTFDAADIKVSSSGAGLESRAIMDLWAFAIAHADKAGLAADETRLKTLLTDALPLWSTIDGAYGAGRLKVDSSFGTLTATNLSQRVAGDGIKTSGRYTYSLGFSDLKTVSPMVPAWAAGLMPEDVNLTITASNVDLDTPARILIDDLDVTRPDKPFSDEAGRKVLAGFTARPPRVVLEPSHIRTADLDMEMKGEIGFKGGSPDLTFTMDVAGLDKTIKTLQDAGAADQMALQVAGGLSMAKGFGKALGDGRTEWVLSVAADGSVSVNGSQLSGPTEPATTEPDATEPGTIDKDAPTDDNALPNDEPLPDDDAITPDSPDDDEGMVPNGESAPDTQPQPQP